MGSSIEELVTLFHDTYTLGFHPVFNTRVRAFNKYVNTLLEALPLVCSGDIETFGMYPRDFSLVIVSISIGRCNISFSGVSRAGAV